MKVLHLTAIAASLGVVAATLPSHSANARQAPAKSVTTAQIKALYAVRKAYGGKAPFESDRVEEDRRTIVECIFKADCFSHFGGKFGPDNVEAVRAKLK